MQEEYVVLVNELDQVEGTMEKIEAHRRALLHRAFSVFVFNSAEELLLQQRAWSKYHSGGLWTNTCCSHPRPNEPYAVAAHRRMDEEMGMHCALLPAFHFIYRAELDHGLTEHELDHVFVSISDVLPQPNPNEVAHFRYIDLPQLDNELRMHPERFTEWFKIIHRDTRHRWPQLLAQAREMEIKA